MPSQIDSAIYMHSPRKAALLSAALPGLGQVYNKKTWKVPVIYAGEGVLIYFAIKNKQNFNVYKDALKSRYDDDPTNIDPFIDIYSDADLIELKITGGAAATCASLVAWCYMP
ncbi:MAG: hypothetical protein IPO27_00495 [Bacteroidetes bacterium]|nr:hypothetical protein [Bacteroidota bacterium]